MIKWCPSKFRNLKTFRRGFCTAKHVFEDMSLKLRDPKIHQLLQAEKARQQRGIILIASENFWSSAVNTAVGSCLTNKYAEGYIGARFYPGCENVDVIEKICQDRALELFKLNHNEWHANVQVMSGTAANIATYNALLKPGERLMALSGKSGGHFSHGFMTPTGLQAISNKFFETTHYAVDEDGSIDYDAAFKLAKEFKPKLIICGYSVHTHDLDYKYFRKIADSVGAYLHLDMAHIAGLIAAGIFKSPFEYIDVATSTTHKTLRGPRGGIILCKKHLSEAIDTSVFPGIQGGPQNHTIAGLAVALHEANTEEFKQYQHQVVANAKALAKGLEGFKYKIRSGGTSNHMVIWDMTPLGLNTVFFEKACNYASITLNPIRINGATVPNSVRVGSMACTTRGYKTNNMTDVALYLHQVLQLTLKLKEKHSQLGDFLVALKADKNMANLKADIENYASGFPIRGL